MSLKNQTSLLIVEEDLIQLKGLTIALMDYFTDIEAVRNPESAISICRQKKIDVLVMDYFFENLTGSNLLKFISEVDNSIKIFVISSQNIEEEINNFNSSLSIKCFEKPIDLSVLIKEIINSTHQ